MRLQRHIQEGSIYINKAYLKEIIKLITNFRDRLVYNINNEPELYQTYDEEALFHELNDFVIKNFSKLKYGFALRIAKQTGTADAYTLIRFKNGKPFGEIALLLDMRRLLESFLRDAKFKAWIKRISATLSHEMIHVAQFRQIADLKTPREFDDLLSAKQKAFVSWSDSERTEVVSNIDKYLADKQEVMAFARGAAQELWNIKDWKVRRKGTPEVFAGEARRDMILDMVRGSGLTKLALFSSSFRNYYNRRKKFPKTWKKFLRHFVDYVTVVESDVSELFKSDIDVEKVAKSRRAPKGTFNTTFAVDEFRYKFWAEPGKGSSKTWWEVGFEMISLPRGHPGLKKGGYEITGTGNAAKVLAGVAKSMKMFIKSKDPKKIHWWTDTAERSRVKLYDRVAKRFEAEGWTLKRRADSDVVSYSFTR